jgi:hypothetical protein
MINSQEEAKRHTPAMNRPIAKPNSCRPEALSEVSAGLHRLPGASNFENPSTKMTATKKTVETMPTRDAYERNDNGRKTVGVRLERKTHERKSQRTDTNVHKKAK